MHRPSRISNTYADTFIKKNAVYTSKKIRKSRKKHRITLYFFFPALYNVVI